jgi:hypothetical protein
MVNTLNLTQQQAEVGETASKMLSILKESSTMNPNDVAKLLADLNDSYASTRVLTPAVVRGDQGEGRNLVHWLGVNYPADTSSRLSFYDDIIQRDKDAILADQVVLDDIRRHHPKVAKAITEEELDTPEEKQFFKTRSEVELRKKELEDKKEKLSTGEQAELKVLKDPTSTKRQADLTRQKYERGFGNDDASARELYYLSQRPNGKSMSEELARLKGELDTGTITEARKLRLNDLLQEKTRTTDEAPVLDKHGKKDTEEDTID